MSDLKKKVLVFNRLTNKWLHVSVEVGADGNLDMKKVEAELKRKSPSLKYAEGGFEFVQTLLPPNVDYIVPVSTHEEAAEEKIQKRRRKLKRELEIDMKF